MILDLGEYGMIDTSYEIKPMPTAKNPDNVLHCYAAVVKGKKLESCHWIEEAALRNFKRMVIHALGGTTGEGYWKPEGNFTGD